LHQYRAGLPTALPHVSVSTSRHVTWPRHFVAPSVTVTSISQLPCHSVSKRTRGFGRVPLSMMYCQNTENQGLIGVTIIDRRANSQNFTALLLHTCHHQEQNFSRVAPLTTRFSWTLMGLVPTIKPVVDSGRVLLCPRVILLARHAFTARVSYSEEILGAQTNRLSVN
jgi:hypothetical protein